MRISALVFVFIALKISSASTQEIDKNNFLTELNKSELSKILFDEIERLDANAISVREQSKNISWKDFRSAMEKNIERAKTKEELAFAIDKVQQGFTNAHSYIQPYPIIGDMSLLYNNPPDKRGFSIGFTYPNISFFSLKSNKEIQYINGINILERFNYFKEFECEFAHANACLNKFIKIIKFGWANLKIKDEVDLIGIDGKAWKENILTTENSKTNSDFCTDYKSSFYSFNLTYSGASVCLLESQNNKNLYILKIRNFIEWGVPQEDFNCQSKAANGTMCNDIKNVSDRLLKKEKVKLVVDLQDNSGGAENTPFMALLSKKSYHDNLVQYRFTKEIKNEEFRKHVFYGSTRAEGWYNKITTENLENSYKEWLPVRSDFCRGDEYCAFKEIPRRKPNLDIDKLILVVNHGCASSCDDLVWRLKRDSGAKVLGQSPVTDGTYVSVTGIIYMTTKGELKSKIIGPGQLSNLPDDVIKLVMFGIPYTKTVSSRNKMLEGSKDVLDELLPITKDNYRNLNTSNVNRALQII
jgi:hypothetical protein